MAKLKVGGKISDETSTYTVIYDYTDKSLKLLDANYSTMKFRVGRDPFKIDRPLERGDLAYLYGGSIGTDVSLIKDPITGETFFPKVKYYELGSRFKTIVGTQYILASVLDDQVAFINLHTGWRFTDPFPVKNYFDGIEESEIPEGLTPI